MKTTTMRTLLFGIVILLGSCWTVGSQAQGAPPPGAPGGPPPGDPLGPDLFIAIRDNRVDQVEDLLKKGAQTEGRNWLGLTPLLWAAARGNTAICTTLLEHKADPNGDSIYGGPLEFATMSGDPKVVKLLMDHGAKFSAKRSDQITPLMVAANTGNVDIMRLLLERKPDVNAIDVAGSTALVQACRRGHLQAAKLLVDAGATVNASDNYGRSPLMYAAMNGYPEVVKLLLEHGAKVNDRDKRGDTALVLNACYGGDAGVAALLVKAGADASVRDSHGRAPAEIALKRGYRACALAIDPHARPGKTGGDEAIAERAGAAVAASLSLIERTTKTFTEHSGCSSCHHQGLGLMTTGLAGKLGFAVDRDLAKSEQKTVLVEVEPASDDIRKLIPHPEMYKHVPAVDMNEFTPGFGMTLCALAGHEAPRTELIESISTILARQQFEDGGWGFGFYREPIQSSRFAMTAYAIRAMNSYFPASLNSERSERNAKALAWLVATPAKNTEDRAFRLLGLKWAGAPQAEIDKAAADLRRTQRPDGGWGQFQGANPAGLGYTRSDAYATGESLFALHEGAGVKPTDAVYLRGVKYLLRTQDDDGSWFVNKRALPANNYFETGFPHGESQFVSYGATCWSAMALMFAAKGA